MQERLHLTAGKVTEWEKQDSSIPAFGSTLVKYHLRPDGSYGYTYYGDHQCSLDRFDVDIETDEVPEEIREILGQPISAIREQIADRFEIVGI